MRLFTVLLLSIIFFKTNAQIPKCSFGTIKRFENFKSKYVDERFIDVWLPEGYSHTKKYAVLYMHDGNGLYDSTIMWNKQEWGVDETISKLMVKNTIRDVIVVGIWNNGKQRHAEYFPQKPYESLTVAEKDYATQQLKEKGRTTVTFTPTSNKYLQFLVTELKPFIDSAFSTKKNRKNTFIAGSSMGGLISMYAICEYPKVFGGAACLSTHWPGIFQVNDNPIPLAFIRYMEAHLPNPKKHTLYFDCGNKTLDALYPPLQAKVDEVLANKGYNATNWLTKFFEGEDHSEKAWAKRLDIPLLFLLKK